MSLGSCTLGRHPLTHSTLIDSYKPVSIRVEHVRAPAKDNIPFDYYPGEVYFVYIHYIQGTITIGTNTS